MRICPIGNKETGLLRVKDEPIFSPKYQASEDNSLAHFQHWKCWRPSYRTQLDYPEDKSSYCQSKVRGFQFSQFKNYFPASFGKKSSKLCTGKTTFLHLILIRTSQITFARILPDNHCICYKHMESPERDYTLTSWLILTRNDLANAETESLIFNGNTSCIRFVASTVTAAFFILL